MSEETYKPTGYFANRAIGHFAPCVIDGQLEEEKAISVYGLNERQLPLLELELLAAGYLEKPADDAPVAITAPLEPIVTDEQIEIDVAHHDGF